MPVRKWESCLGWLADSLLTVRERGHGTDRLGLTEAGWWMAGAGHLPQDALYAPDGPRRPPTRVACVAGLGAAGIAEKGITYVGRPNQYLNLTGHPLGNPFRMHLDRGKPKEQAAQEARAHCVAEFRAYLRADPKLCEIARSLAGETLGCWCGEWCGLGEPAVVCHAVEVAHVAEGR